MRVKANAALTYGGSTTLEITKRMSECQGGQTSQGVPNWNRHRVLDAGSSLRLVQEQNLRLWSRSFRRTSGTIL